MSENISPLKYLRESAGMRLAVLFGSFFVLLIVTTFIGVTIDSLSLGSKRDHLLWGSVVQNILAFCIPAVLVAKFSSKEYKKWLRLNNPPKIKALLGVLVVYLISMPAMEALIDWNANLRFPESMSTLENVLRGWEENSEKTTEILLEVNGWLPMVVGVLVIGMITGFSEELFFRGGLQGILTRSNLNTAGAVWLAAFVFSTMHFQFFGFVPRLLMGVFFGYLLIWTKSIWVPVFAHVLNNSMVVITAAIYGDHTASFLEKVSSNELLQNSFVTILSSVFLTALFLIFCRNFIFKNCKSSNALWQRSQPQSGSGI